MRSLECEVDEARGPRSLEKHSGWQRAIGSQRSVCSVHNDHDPSSTGAAYRRPHPPGCGARATGFTETRADERDCAPPAQNTVLEASAIPRPTTMTAHAGEPSHYYKYKNVWALSRSCFACGAEHQGLTLSEGSGDRASAGATSVGCSSLWLSCPWDKLPQVSILDGT